MFHSKSPHPTALLFAAALTLLSPAGQAINWNYLDGPFGGQPFALTIDADGNTWAGLNGSGVYVRASGATKWIYEPGLPTQSNGRMAVDSNGTAYTAGSGGLYALARGDTSWRELDGADGLPGGGGSDREHLQAACRRS